MLRRHPFHLVDNSPWPLLASLTAFLTITNFLVFFHSGKMYFTFFFLLFLISFFWWRDVVRESTYLRFHTKVTQKNILNRIIWFISSEVFFFLRFFWAFFHSSLSPSITFRILWPPVRINVLNPLSVPLLNTVVLLSSRITVTWSHYSIYYNNRVRGIYRLTYTIFLGFFFTLLQYVEYSECSFTITDSVYRSCFFLATGFHRLHVLVGSIFLLVSLYRICKRHFTSKQHVRLECSIWYWHFVDVVWVFLYLSIYWWRSYL